MHLLIVEDEKDLNRILVKRLTAEGYVCESAYDGQSALDDLNSEAVFDAVILDWMLPGISGIEVLTLLRAQGKTTPVLMLTARDAISDRVKGLDQGADDYLIKPFAFDELLARVRMITRKAAGSKTNLLTIGDLSVDLLGKTVHRQGIPIHLSAKEFMILEVLLRNKNIVLSRESIESRISLFDKEINSNVIDVYIRFLRKKIDEGHDIKLIQTVRGSGYVIREP